MQRSHLSPKRPSPAVKTRWQAMCARRRRLTPLFYGSAAGTLGFTALMACCPTLLPTPLAIVLAAAGGAAALVSDVLYTMNARCPSCGLPIFRLPTPKGGPFCGLDFNAL